MNLITKILYIYFAGGYTVIATGLLKKDFGHLRLQNTGLAFGYGYADARTHKILELTPAYTFFVWVSLYTASFACL
jgi:hypothetical protein